MGIFFEVGTKIIPYLNLRQDLFISSGFTGLVLSIILLIIYFS